MSEIERRIGGRIAELRKIRNLNQNELAEKAQLTQESVSRLERGVILPSLKTMDRVAQALEIPLKEFFDVGSDPNNDPTFEKELHEVMLSLRTLQRKDLVVVRKILQEAVRVLHDERSKPVRKKS